MNRTASSSRWRGALEVVAVVLTLRAAVPARADDAAVTEQTSQALPLPPPGTSRLIRIGPQALIREDDRGRLTMADEPAPKPSRGQRLFAVLFGVVAAGAVLTLGRNEVTTDVGGRAGGR
jgi:hypothetical protein